MREYQASIIYEEETVGRLDAAICNTFFFGRRIVYLCICLCLIVGGVILGISSTQGIICILLGSFLLPSVISMKSRNARQVIRAMKGQTLTMDYTFRKDGFTCRVASGESEHTYDTIIRLVEEKDYLYLFQKTTQACMIRVSTITPGSAEEFKTFISQKAGLAWTAPNTFLTFSFHKSKFNRKNTRLSR